MMELREAAYTGPGGLRSTFDYEDVSVTVDKKTTGYNFPDANGTYVQDTGHTGRQYPLRMYLWGDGHAERAEALEASLLERGAGKLEHPAYGAVNVVPYGSITRRDDLKTGGNQTVIEVTFWETIGLIYPTAQAAPASEVTEAVEEFNKTVDFEGVTSASFVADYSRLLETAEVTLSPIADATDRVGREFKRIVNSVRSNILDPIALGVQTLRMIQSAARSGSAVRAGAYDYLLIDILSRRVTPSDYKVREAFAMGAVSGTVITLVNSQFTTKAQALDAADRLLEQFGALVTWRDNNHIGVDTGESYQALQKAVALTAGYLVEISFTLKLERRLVLDRARTIIDLSAELYGAVDDKLDFLINSNNLTGSEILEIPRGREIVYYV